MERSLGVVMIVRNEEAMLADCLDSVAGADAIVISDTGSTDGTIEIAKRYTDKVYTDFKWNDNFSKARNAAKSRCCTDWILSIDADERLSVPFSEVRAAANQAFMAVDCKLYASNNGQFHLFPRLFRNSPQVWWVGAIHNHLSVLGEQVGDVRITYGYSPAHDKDPDRALRILEREAAKPESTREKFYLGRELYYRGRYEDAVRTLGRYVQESKYLAEKSEAFLIMSYCYWRMTPPDADSARDACLQAICINPDWEEPLKHMAVLAGRGSGNERFERNAARWDALAAMAENHDVLFLRK